MDSILPQLGARDEIVVVDDCSSDDTVAVLRRYGDPRMRIHLNEKNGGHVFSFGKALSLATREVIFMADQDDKWVEGRVAAMVRKLQETGALVVSANSAYMDANGREIACSATRLDAGDADRRIKNILGMFTGKTAYYGCAMALRREILDLVLPIPRFVESHDLWIAMASNLLGSNAHLQDDMLVRRVHGNNASIVRRSLYLKSRARIIFCQSIAVLLARAAKFRSSP